MKPMSNRPKSKEEQFLSDYLGKIGQGPGETGTIAYEPIAALGRIEHRLDVLVEQRDDLLAQLKALAVQVKSVGLIVPPGVEAAIARARETP